jgi:hypothetical protein
MEKKKEVQQYMVRKFGELWGIVRVSDETLRPVNERLYTQATHAYRRCRKLNQAAREIDAMIARDGAIIL